MFYSQPVTFQQDSVQKAIQTWFLNNSPEFISFEELLFNRHDLRPLEYKLWIILNYMAYHKIHQNLDSLKIALKLAMGEVRATIDD